MQQLGFGTFHRNGVIDDILAALDRVKAQVLNAVLVAAAVKDFLRIDANGLLNRCRAILQRAGNDLLRHIYILL